ncbi:MAG TPA: C4-type zinc ribbon domain-containing protein [Acidimicrobiia bacterium]
MTVSGLYDLLEVQKIDLEIDRLLDRRQSLPELEEYKKAHETLQKLEKKHATASDELRELERSVDKSEGELSILESKLNEHETRLFAGGMSSRETEYMRLEVESLRGQREAMEGRVLALLDQLDPAREEVARLQAKIDEARAEHARLDAAIREAWRQIDAELARKEEAKKEALGSVPPDLVDMYEDLRHSKEGVAIAAFENGVCGGCHMALSPSEREEAFSTDLPRCVHCRRILVA